MYLDAPESTIQHCVGERAELLEIEEQIPVEYEVKRVSSGGSVVLTDEIK